MKKFRYALLSLFLIFTVNMTKAQNPRFQFIEITDQLSANQFDDIKKFILDKGEIKLHGSRYGFIPFYEFQSAEVFLIDEKEFWRDMDFKDYTLLQIKASQGNDLYKDPESKKIYFYANIQETEEQLKERAENIKSSTDEILKEVYHKEPNSLDITSILNYSQFTDIKEFVLDKKQGNFYKFFLNSCFGFLFEDFYILITDQANNDKEIDPKTYTSMIIMKNNGSKIKINQNEAKMLTIVQDTLNQRILLTPRYDTEESLQSKSEMLEPILNVIMPIVKSK